MVFGGLFDFDLCVWVLLDVFVLIVVVMCVVIEWILVDVVRIVCWDVIVDV